MFERNSIEILVEGVWYEKRRGRGRDSLTGRKAKAVTSTDERTAEVEKSVGAVESLGKKKRAISASLL